MPVYNYIIAQARDPSGKPLALHAQSPNSLVKNLQWGNENQLWEKRTGVRTNDTNAFALVNKATGKALARDQNHQGARLILVNESELGYNDLAVWRHDNVQGTYNAINSLADWEQKINIPGNGPYTDGQTLITWEWSGAASNELWVFNPDTTSQSLINLTFNMDLCKILDMEPKYGNYITVQNDGETEITRTVEVAAEVTKTQTFEWTSGAKVSVTMEVTAGVPKIAETKTSVTVEASIGFSNTQTVSETSSWKDTITVSCPPKKKTTVVLVINQGRMEVPYIATLQTTYPDKTVKTETSQGIFKVQQGYSSFTKAT